MSVSIYYTATRPSGLSEQERLAVASTAERFSVDKALREYLATGVGLNWESFCLYDTLRPGEVLSGATKLPDNSDAATWVGVQHWCDCLTALRRVLPDATWSVSVDDHEIQWDEAALAYDPSK